MKVSLKYILVLCFFLYTNLNAKYLPWFDNLKNNETITIHFYSNGCFGGDSDDYTFSTKKNKVFLGSRELSKLELKKLNEVFYYYESKPKGGCTQTDYISLTKYKGNKVLNKVAYEDGSCGYTTLYRIIKDIKENKYVDFIENPICTKINTKIDKVICSDTKLKAYHTSVINYFYIFKFYTHINVEATKVISLKQENWLHSRIEKCPSMDVKCLTKYYKEEINKFDKHRQSINCSPCEKEKIKIITENKETLSELIEKKLLRKATVADLTKWGKINRTVNLSKSYIILDKIKIPKNVQDINLFLNYNVPYPEGNTNNISLFDFNTMTYINDLSNIEKPLTKWPLKFKSKYEKSINKFKSEL